MTMIIGMKTANSIIVASDGLAKYNLRGLEHLGFQTSETTEKVWAISPLIMLGIAGSKVNLMQKFRSDVTAFAGQHPSITADHIAKQLPQYIERTYAHYRGDPDFFITVFLAGVTETGVKSLYLVNNGEVMMWPEDNIHPWLTAGHENQVPDAYIASQYKGKLLSKARTTKLLKDAIAVAGRNTPEGVGGHTFIYEITNKEVIRLE